MKKVVNAKHKAITAYRLISWLLTSLIYIMESPENIFKYTIAVVVSLLVITVSLNDLYLKSHSKAYTQRVNIAETLVIAILLTLTGGLDSPFIWYAINPVLIAGTFLGAAYWVYLCFYLIVGSITSQMLFNPDHLRLNELILEKIYVIMVFILITIAIRLLLALVQHLDRQAEALKNQKEHIMSLYRIVEAYSAREDNRNVLENMLKLANEIIGSRASFIFLVPCKDVPASMVTANISEAEREILYQFFQAQSWENDGVNVDEILRNHIFYAVNDLIPLQSASRLYGILGFSLAASIKVEMDKELVQFLADIITMILERNHFEAMSSQLLILEEQNRIGNEIHDNVSQILFSIVYGLHALGGNWSNLSRDQIERKLKILEQSAKNVSTELRASIYGLSPRKRGEKVFETSIRNYLSDFSTLNEIHVHVDFHGEEEQITYPLKHAMFRIIREGCGNAVWHGQCDELKMQVKIDQHTCELMIQDNGIGFNYEDVQCDKNNKGLGLHNMKAIAQTYCGSFAIQSEPEHGTTLRFEFPIYQIANFVTEQKGGVA
ncbi:ATP-binding protein [Dehalobacter sp. MCB1]|uniref:sensor histidine kinase n=1 Tax=Dehalobacter sp. MCB1 TaxID=1844756 RepID=UPI0013142DE8|nr:ATP-binding protein [Dehalobacter sp. MCB1]